MAAPPSAAMPADLPKPPKPPKGKKVAVQEVVLEVTTRGKKKCVTVINGERGGGRAGTGG